MSRKLIVDRRTFLKAAAATGAALPLGAASWARTGGINSKLNVAGVGVGGMGATDVAQVGASPNVNIVALCDIDANKLQEMAAKFPNAKTFADWREMYETMGDQIDAVTVTTPDHMHAPIAMTAINTGKHVYCQKPLTHNIFEARQLHKAANRAGVATQMGIQGQAEAYARQSVAAAKSGAIGTIKHIYTWSDRPRNWWPQGGKRKPGSDAIPAHVSWDLWLGVAEERPYLDKAYHPFAWRGVLDFGTGALGDMGCHIFQRPFEALELAAPRSVIAKTEGPTDDQYPLTESIHFIYPGNKFSDGKDLPLTWYDGGQQPSREQLGLSEGDPEVPSNGSALVGEEGTLMIPLYAGPWFTPAAKFESVVLPDFEPRNHWHHWVDAARGEVRKTAANFDLAVPITEAVLLGALASRVPHQELKWDSDSLRITNVSEANAFVRRTYRKGWEVKGL